MKCETLTAHIRGNVHPIYSGVSVYITFLVVLLKLISSFGFLHHPVFQIILAAKMRLLLSAVVVAASASASALLGERGFNVNATTIVRSSLLFVACHSNDLTVLGFEQGLAGSCIIPRRCHLHTGADRSSRWWLLVYSGGKLKYRKRCSQSSNPLSIAVLVIARLQSYSSEHTRRCCCRKDPCDCQC